MIGSPISFRRVFHGELGGILKGKVLETRSDFYVRIRSGVIKAGYF